MQVTRCLLASALGWLAAASPSYAESSRFLITVQGGSPAHLCVVSRQLCGGNPTSCRSDVALSTVARLLDNHGSHRYGLRGDRHIPPAEHLPPPVVSALEALGRPHPEQTHCRGDDSGACDPEIDLSAFTEGAASSPGSSASPFSGHVMCRSRDGAPPATSDREGAAAHRNLATVSPDDDLQRDRVVFLALTLLDPQFHIQELEYRSDTLTVKLDHGSPTTAQIRVMGGDYAIGETTVSGTHQNLPVKLRPRCALFNAEVPSNAARIASVSLSSPSLNAIAAQGPGPRCSAGGSDTASSPRTRSENAADSCPDLTCVPDNQTSHRIPIALPVTAAIEEKRLVVTYDTSPPTTSEVRWSEAEPPVPLRLGLRSIRFSWRPPVGCLADRWAEPAPATAWTQSCPRATLSGATECNVREPLSSAGRAARATCEYHCVVKDGLPSPNLPIPVTFDRARAHVAEPPSSQPAPDEEVLYSWHDQLGFSGQELTSVVAPADRRVMLEFADRSQWEDRLGDKIDAIRVSSGQSTTQFDLRDRYHPEVPPRWVSLPSAGRTCSDRVRIAIVGTRHYEEASLEAKDGRIELAHPYEYHRSVVPYGLFGGGQLFRHPFSNARSAAFGDLGLGAQFALPGRDWRAWSIDLEATGQLTHTFYEGIELSDRQKADFTAVSYLRFDLRIALEWWLMRHVGVAVALGAGLGTPLDAGDAHLVGALRTSALFELQPVFTMFPRRLWLMPGAGCRGLENHADYHTDFIGSPTPRTESDLQCYLFLRFRATFD